MSLVFLVKDITETGAMSQQIGKALRGGECIELLSDVGGGKTTFVRGLVRGAGSSDHVSSPTFAISKIYSAPKFNIAHFDFYRLSEPGLIEHEIADIIDDKKTVTVIEWSDIVANVLPDDRLKISIKILDDQVREVTFDYPSNLAYLIAGLQA